MGYLTLSRREGETIRLTIDPGVDVEALAKQLLRDGITIYIGEMHGGQVKVGVEAPKLVMVMREELCQTIATNEHPNGVRLVL